MRDLAQTGVRTGLIEPRHAPETLSFRLRHGNRSSYSTVRFDVDDDVDLIDFAGFQNVFTGD